MMFISAAVTSSLIFVIFLTNSASPCSVDPLVNLKSKQQNTTSRKEVLQQVREIQFNQAHVVDNRNRDVLRLIHVRLLSLAQLRLFFSLLSFSFCPPFVACFFLRTRPPVFRNPYRPSAHCSCGNHCGARVRAPSADPSAASL